MHVRGGFARSARQRRDFCRGNARSARSRKACIPAAACQAWLFAARRAPAGISNASNRHSRERGRRAAPTHWKHFYWRKRPTFRKNRERRDAGHGQVRKVAFVRRRHQEWRRREREGWWRVCSHRRTREIWDARVSFSSWKFARKDRGPGKEKAAVSVRSKMF